MADDDPDDHELIREAMEDAGYSGRISFVENGEELLNCLLGKGTFAGELPATPDLILLDLNMPRVNGYDALEAIKQHPDLRRTPVVVLTTSSRRDDIDRIYDLGGNSFITKPSSYPEFAIVARNLMQYWLETVRLPTRPEEP